LRLLPLILGYNTKFYALNWLVQAHQVVNKVLADNLECFRSKKKWTRNSQEPCGYFHEISFSPDEWTCLEELTNKLAVSLLLWMLLLIR
ncbi:hypothetical protein DFH28DRAFT_885460, partial [Melampsora americana]